MGLQMSIAIIMLTVAVSSSGSHLTPRCNTDGNNKLCAIKLCAWTHFVLTVVRFPQGSLMPGCF